MLENIRFNQGEEANDMQFSKKLSSLGDIFVNDAFSCSHRSHSSIEGIAKHIPSYYGLQITQEIQALKKITSEIKKPVTLIIGGSKISSKINIINKRNRTKLTRGRKVKVSGFKKAIITLKKGQSIDLTTGV